MNKYELIYVFGICGILIKSWLLIEQIVMRNNSECVFEWYIFLFYLLWENDDEKEMNNEISGL